MNTQQEYNPPTMQCKSTSKQKQIQTPTKYGQTPRLHSAFDFENIKTVLTKEPTIEILRHHAINK